VPPKSRPPVPIDRPLSKAYLREFAGWSTNYPPGLSEPNSLRVMENVQVSREGAARVRPGLRSYMRTKSPWPIVGSHEIFYTKNGKCYLVAVRETVDVGTADEREIVGFRVIGPDSTGTIIMGTLASFGFDVPADPNVLSFTEATTYVKYLQIDNKIFALSNQPEGMLMFWVGDEKKAKKLASIVRPSWNTADKLSVMQPTSAWVLGNVPSSTRRNLCTNPDVEQFETGWVSGGKYTDAFRTNSVPASVGSYSMAGKSLPVRVNYATYPLHDVATTGTVGWSGVYGAVSASGSSLRFTLAAGKAYGYARSDMLKVDPGKRMRLAFDLAGSVATSKLRTWVRFYRSNGDLISTVDVYSSSSTTVGRRRTNAFSVPTQATQARLQIGLNPTTTNGTGRIDINDVFLGLDALNNTLALDGNDGAGYYWEGATNGSRSVYQPDRDIVIGFQAVPVVPGNHTVSVAIRGNTGRTCNLELRALKADGTVALVATTASVGTGAFARKSTTINVPAGAVRLQTWIFMRGASRSDRIYADACLIETGAVAGSYFSGSTPSVGTTKRRWTGKVGLSASVEEVWDPILPTPQVPADGTLVSSNGTKNRYNFSFFYTISNELGESAASQVTTVKGQRPQTAWQWLDPAGANTNDPKKCHDQLTATMPQEVFDAAIAAGATKWTAYYFFQGPNEPPSVTATRFAEIDLTNEPVYGQHGYARLTPQLTKIGIGDPLVPSESTRINASDPVKGSNGIVAADRLILVGNPADPARITWSSGAPGDYHNFSPLLGGGSKQLTSGNLYTTATVKLWQNPQSVDTLTILNMGDDGRSNAYYMQPANITSLSESISVMGFEEVTAMQGTVSPYGCEVVSNGLYRPLFHGVYKSTANNYNISTKPVSDSIQNTWRTLNSPHRIVSAQLDSRIYYLVHNIGGAALEQDCRGNEVWVLDLATPTPTWSRWTVQGASLRAMDIDDVVMMSIVRPDGIFVFNEDRYSDERFNVDTGVLEDVPIKWYLETNIQGANRAHDAWCNLQQSNAMVGNFIGQLRYGIRGKDVHGKDVEIEKVLVSINPPPDVVTEDEILDGYVMPTLSPTEREDYLLVRKIMKEWVFFAGSVDDVVEVDGTETLVPRFGGGQINSVQYRYTPATVNVGYEYGSVETFEYGASALANATTDSGTPKPYVDMSRT
jgi:hypothetical protein